MARPLRALVMDVSGVDEVELAGVPASSASVTNAAAGRAALVEQKEARIRKLAEWDQLDRTQKRQLGLATTDVEWAKVEGLNHRRVAKYRSDPYYAEYVAKLTSVAKKRIAPAGSASLADFASSTASGVDDLSDYTAIKQQVAALAKQGDQKSLDLWLKHWGKPFLDEETSNRVADLASMTDVTLVEQLISLINVDLLQQTLVDAGWQSTPPSCETADRPHGEQADDDTGDTDERKKQTPS